MNNTCRPYSDNYLFYDENTNHYVLTEKALIENVGVKGAYVVGGAHNTRNRNKEPYSNRKRYDLSVHTRT